MQILISLVMLVALPCFFLFLLHRAKFKYKLLWLLDAVMTSLVIIWVFKSGNWSWISSYLPYLYLVILVVVLINSYIKVKELPWLESFKKSDTITLVVYSILILVFGFYNVQVLQAYQYNDEALDLLFPLKEGDYVIGQGGNSTMMNYHNAYEDQKYALDILKINELGTRANGLYPKKNTQFEIYGDRITSPCDASILESENDLENMVPGEMDTENIAGNHVWLKCDHAKPKILLAHMMKGSVQVQAGDTVKAGQMIGKVGNSGNTTEPHLHIHAEINGQGVPITFYQNFPVRNKIIQARYSN